MSQHVEAQLLRAMANAKTLSEQARLAAELDAVRAARTAALHAERNIELADAVIRETLTPARTHVFHTAATDWLDESAEIEDGSQIHTAMVSEASAWYARVSPEVKEDREEFAEQAFGMARRVAGRFTDVNTAQNSFLQYVGYLQSREAASGLDQIQQTVDPNNQDKTTPLPTEVFDNFAPEVAPENQGKDEQVASTSAPLLQEILNGSGGSGTPEVPNSHTTTDTDTNGAVLVGGDTHRDVHNTASLAINHIATLDDYRREAALRAQLGESPNFSQAHVAKSEKDMLEDGHGVETGKFTQQEDASGPTGEEKKTAAGKCKNCTNGNHTGTNGTEGCSGGSCSCGCKKSSEPKEMTDVLGDKPKKKLSSGHGICASCGQPVTQKVTANGVTLEHTMRQKDGHHPRLAASGLDQIEQTIDPNNTPKTTAIPGDVMFPINPNWNTDRPNQGGSNETEGDTSAEVNSRHTTSVRKQADNAAFERPFDWGGYHHDVNNFGSAMGPMTTDRGMPDPKTTPQMPPHGPPGAVPDFNEMNSHAQSCPSCGGRLAALLKQSDMFGNSDYPHKIPNPDVMNSDRTTPQESGGSYQTGFNDGKADGARQDAPTFADQSSHVRPYVDGYSEGYDAGFPDGHNHQDVPYSMHGLANVHPDYEKGFNFASKWTPESPLVATGSAEFEAGLYAGIRVSEHSGMWVQAHRKHAVKFPYLLERLDRAKRVTAALSAQAATSMDLDTHDPAGNASANGDTPFNGIGSTPPLDGGTDPARGDGPAPYNGANPMGHSVVPGANQTPHKPSPMTSQPPVKQDSGIAPLNPQTMAFRKRVQAALLQDSNN